MTNISINYYIISITNACKNLILFNIMFFMLISSFSCKKEEERVMMVRNDTIMDVSYTTAKAIATIIDQGEGIKQHGHCWSTNIEYITTDNETKSENGSVNTTGSYSSNLTGLSPNTSYFVKAYITNGAEVVYGNKVLSFHTLSLSTPEVTTGTVTNIKTTSASVTANLNNLGEGETLITQHGHCWSNETATPTINDDNKSSLGTRDSTGIFESHLVGLTRNMLYYVRAYATNDAGTAYGDTVSFITNAELPVISTSAITSITDSSARSGGAVSDDGGATVTARGVCWSPAEDPDLSGSFTDDGSGTGTFTSNITELLPGTKYYVRAYATNIAGTAYGNQVSFTTVTTIPTVITKSISSITETSAQSGGNVASSGGATVTARGVCWSDSENPSLDDSYTTDGSGTGSFTSYITGLSAGTTYFVRAYAINNAGTAYGDTVSFVTNTKLPVISTSAITSITDSSAKGGGTVSDDGGAAVTARGVCWSTAEDPDLSDSYTDDGSGTGTFTSNITELLPGTTYYARAYATSLAGTNYGNQVSFTTATTIPTVTTAGISSITETSAQSGGNVTSDGGEAVTARGVCWSDSENPTLSDSYTSDGSGTGSFTSYITGLTPGATYYVRAYATNINGTDYGNELILNTKYIAIDWQKSLGGPAYDVANSVCQTSDGGYIIAGGSESSGGDISGNHGSSDCWIVKLTSTGIIDWQKALGGTDYDAATSIQQTTDGGYIIAGYSESNDGDVSGNHGGIDYWIVKITSAGILEWQKSLGGSSSDAASSIQQTADGGYIIAGISSSNDNDVSGNHGSSDCWIVKLTSEGNIDWQKSLGGSAYDRANFIQQTTDGGYIIAGVSESNDGDVSGNYGSWDCWIVKLTSTGNIDWQNAIGGDERDACYSIKQTADGGYILAGYSESNNYDVAGNHGGRDYWIVKLTSSGVITWQKSLGGSYSDMAYSIQQTTDGGYIVAGYSESNDYDVSGNHGFFDYWIVNLTSTGKITWQKSFGGSGSDEAYTIQQTTNGNYIVCGSSASDDGDVTGHYGGCDYWIVKINED